MSNFIGMVFATLKKEGIDTSNMDVNDAVAKYNEIKGTNGGQGAKGEETPKETQNTAEQGKETAKTSKEPEQAKAPTQSNYKLQESDYTIIDDTIEDGDTKEDVIDKLDKSGFLGGNKPQVLEYLDKKMGNGSTDEDQPKYKEGQVLVNGDGSEWKITGTSESVADVHTGRKGKCYVLENTKTGATTETPCWYAEKHNTIKENSDASKLQKSMGVSPDEAKSFAKGDGHLSKDGGYQGVNNAKDAPKFEYKSQNLQDDVWNKQYCTEQLKNKSEKEQWQFITDIMQIRHDQYEDYKKKTGENITYKDFVATKGKLR